MGISLRKSPNKPTQASGMGTGNCLYRAGYFLSLILLLIQSPKVVASESPFEFRWARSINATNTVAVGDITSDTSSNVYVAGYSFSQLTFDQLTVSNYNGNLGANMFIGKYDASGTIQWVWYNNGTNGITQIRGITTDNANNVYVAANLIWTADFGTFSVTNLNGGNSNILIAKYDSTGSALWARLASWSDSGLGYDVTTDSDGNAYIAGSFTLTSDPGNPNLLGDGLADACLAKYDSSGNLLWFRLPGGNSVEQGRSVCTDSAKNVYLAGTFKTTLNFGTTNLTSNGGIDIFLAKYNSSGTFQWVRQVGGTGDEGASPAVKIGPADEVYLAGAFNGSVTIGSTPLTSAGAADVFLAKYDGSGNVAWAQQAGGTGTDALNALAVDPTGNILITGFFNNTISFGSTNLTSLGNGDGYVAKYTSSGTLLWAIQAGGTASDSGIGIATNPNGDVLLGGTFSSPQLQLGLLAVTNTSGNVNGFVTKLITPGPPFILTDPVGSVVTNGATVNLTVTSGGAQPLSYHWQKDNVDINGATGSTLRLSNVQATDGASYRVRISNSQGTVYSATAPLVVVPVPNPMTNYTHTGTNVILSISATGPAPITYQWQKDGVNIDGATGSSLTFTNPQVSDGGSYSVVVTAGGSSVTNQMNSLIVNLIDAPSRVDLAYDDARNILYISSGTTVLRYRMGYFDFLTPFQFTGTPMGMDISPDGNKLAIADSMVSNGSNWIHIVDLPTGTISNIGFPLSLLESGTYSVAYGIDGALLITSQLNGSGPVPLRRYDPGTGIVTTNANVFKNSMVTASGDRNVIGLAQSGTTGGPIAKFDVVSKSFVKNIFTGWPTYEIAVNHDGTQFAVPTYDGTFVFDANLTSIITVGQYAGDHPVGAVYHPISNLVYFAWVDTTDVSAFDTQTFQEVNRYSGVGAFTANGNYAYVNGRMKMSQKGDFLFTTFDGGVRFISLSATPVHFDVQPQNQTTAISSNIIFNCAVSGTGTFFYQWQKNGTNIAGATNASLSLSGLTLNDSGNYAVTVINPLGSAVSSNATLTVLLADPGVNWATPADITYGAALSTSQLNATASVPGTFVYTPAKNTKPTAGSNQVLSVAFTPTDTVNYRSTTNTVKINVLQAGLTVTANNAVRTYGANVGTLTGTITGLVNSDNITANYSSTAVISSPVGGYPITPSFIDPNNRLPNYLVTTNLGTLTVNKAALTVTGTSTNRFYADANPAFNGTLSGIRNSDPITATFTTAATTASSAGNYSITPLLSDPNSRLSNYNVTTNNGTFTINKVALTVTANAASRHYGETDPTFTGSITGIKNNDNLTLSFFTSAVISSPVGNYPVTPLINDPDTRLPNYTVTTNNGTLTISKANLSITADDASRAYGASNPAFTGSILGLANNDPITGVYTSTATPSSVVGTYVIKAALSDPNSRLGNYSVTTNNATLTITKTALTVTADDKSRAYGAPNPTLTGSLTGLANNDSITGSYATSATPSSPAGNYVITATLSDPNARLSNYTVTTNNGTLTVSRAGLSVTADDKSRVYGAANPTFTGNVAGLVNGDNITASFASAAAQSSTVGTYPITPSLTDPNSKLSNYSVTTNNGTLTITKGQITVAANDANRAYGSQNPSFSGNLTGLVNSDNITASFSSTAVPSSPVGTYSITPSLTDANARLSNYSVVTNNGTLTVTKAQLTSSANDANRAYGASNPTFSGSLSGLQNNDSIAASYATTATPASAVGTYTITITLSDPNSRLANYTVTTNNGTLTVTKASLTLTGNNTARTAGAQNPVFTGTITGLKNSDDITANWTCSATPSSPPGAYNIVPSLVDPGSRLINYLVTTNNGILTVTLSGPPVITLPSGDLTYNENAGPIVLDAAATVSDGGNPNFNTGVLNLGISENASADDRLFLLNQGGGSGQIGVTNSAVSFSGQIIGTITGGTNGTPPITVTFNASANTTALQALVRRIAFENDSDNPSILQRKITVTLSNSDGNQSSPVDKLVHVIAVNDAPNVNITAPTNNAQFNAGSSVVLKANATDVDGTIVKVEFFDGATKLGESSASPFQFTWNNLLVGVHAVTAKATDNQQATTISSAVSIVVNSAIQTPSLNNSGQFQLTFMGVPDITYSVQVSTDLIHWTPIGNITVTNGSAPFVDPNATGIGKRFYRIVPLQ